jgi:3-dehydroquinate dehydratase
MRKTAGQIERDIFGLIKTQVLSVISGGVYRKGLRPKGSELEDAVISFMTGDAEQVQTGVLNLNVYVKNINVDGSLVCDIARCTEIEAELMSIIESMVSTEYSISIGSAIQTFEEPKIEQHFVNCKIKYKRIII